MGSSPAKVVQLWLGRYPKSQIEFASSIHQMEYKFTYVSEEELDLIYESGLLAKTYFYPYKDMDEDFAAKELQIAKKLESEVDTIWGAEKIDCSYDSWADKTIRSSIDQSLLSIKFLDFLYDSFIKKENFERCIFCLVMENLEDVNSNYLGRFVIHEGEIIIVKELEIIWKIKVGAGN